MAILCFALIVHLLAVYLFCRIRALKQKIETDRLKEQAESRLRYIRSLLDMVYTYQRKPEQLLVHLREEMSVNKLLSYHIIEDRCNEVFDPALKIGKKDQILYLLLEEGFTSRELCVMLELNNLNSVYVKYHRVRKKLSNSGVVPPEDVVSEDIVPEVRVKQGARLSQMEETTESQEILKMMPDEAG